MPARVMHNDVLHGKRRDGHPHEQEDRDELEPNMTSHEVVFRRVLPSITLMAAFSANTYHYCRSFQRK
jgi:hypothetical protein